MSLDELKIALDLIPDDTPINRAKRKQIIILINKITAGEEE